jgi:hypothetical protein
MGMLLLERREYIHVGSCATSLLRNVQQKHSHAHTLKVSVILIAKASAEAKSSIYEIGFEKPGYYRGDQWRVLST